MGFSSSFKSFADTDGCYRRILFAVSANRYVYGSGSYSGDLCIYAGAGPGIHAL